MIIFFEITHFLFQISGFLFLHQTLQQGKFEEFKYDNTIFKLYPKNMQIKHFCSQILRFLFCTKLCNLTNSRALISNMTMPFSNSARKYWSKTFFAVNVITFLFLYETSHTAKFDGTDFKNGNILAKFQPKTFKYKILFKNSKVFSFEFLKLIWVNFILFSKTQRVISKCYCYSREIKTIFFKQKVRNNFL